MARKVRILRKGTVLPNKIFYDLIGQVVTISNAEFERITPETFSGNYIEDLGEVDLPSTNVPVKEMDPNMIVSMVLDRLPAPPTAPAAPAAPEPDASMSNALAAETARSKAAESALDARLATLANQMSALTEQTSEVASQTAPLASQIDALGTQATFLASQTASLNTQTAALAARTVKVVGARVALPALAAGAVREIPVTWSPAPAKTPSATLVLIEPVGSLLGSLTAGVKTGSVTGTGCVLTALSPVLLALGNGYLNAFGFYWS